MQIKCKSKLNLFNKQNAVVVASTSIALKKVPKLFGDEGSWYVNWLELKGFIAGSTAKIGVQVSIKSIAFLAHLLFCEHPF